MNKRIRELRERLNLSQVAFAERAGMSRSIVSNMELGLVEIPDYRIRSIVNTFSVSEHWLRTGEGEMFAERPVSALPAELTESPIIRAMLEAYLDLTPDNRKVFEQFFQNVVERCAAAAADPAPGDQVLNAATATGAPVSDDRIV